ncbi:DUF1565 domain-containing protein [Pseudanabaena mucicola]|uniref:DUF1565 domain-containing protein n=1 Tax=Pseudanabaena mucicola FACHB-723 TaxID=2692860 RepID=A0ABR8A024_9CYAN|nr:DUF1565 domain-containing protein [Pseudanabaena mucicola]MBD2188896.1 DUF1565 domain-containing protein [Pseudanabaena mucicola FACHB-723]
MRCKPSLFSAIATSLTFLVVAPPIWAGSLNAPQIAQPTDNLSQLPQMAALLYVSPNANSNGDGSPNNPYGSITAALATNPTAGTVIQLQQGVYTEATGEIFPIKLPVGVTLRGEPTVRGINTIIRGGGRFLSPSFASQNIMLLADNDTRIEGITLTNPNTRGTAIWAESSKRVTLANNTFANSNREGLFLAGTADVIVNENLFKQNGANGISAVGNSTGEIRNNTFESTGFGLAIGQNSRVNVTNNNIINNVDGIVISNLAAPVLRNNLITNNKRDGIVILKDRKGYPTPDLGTSTNLGNNTFKDNLGKDLNNNSGVTQVAVGNDLNSKKIAGNIAFVGESPAAPAPTIASTPIPTPSVRTVLPVATNNKPVVPSQVSNANTIEITKAPAETSFKPPITPPTALAPSSSSIFVEPLPDVPQPISGNASSTSNNLIAAAPKSSQTNSQVNNEILIERDPVPSIPTQPLRSQFIPSTPPAVPNTSPNTLEVTPTTSTPVSAAPVPYNPQIAALVPPPANETFPYLVVIPSADGELLGQVRSAVPTAKIISSRFGNIIMVQGYPDRDRAEVLKVIMRSGIGVDARVIHQNSL